MLRIIFQRPNPFTPDIAVDIPIHTDRKYILWRPMSHNILSGCHGLPEDWMKFLIMLKKDWIILPKYRKVRITEAVKESLVKWYGKDKAVFVTDAEAFEICEYGRRPDDDEIRRLFP